MRTHIISVLVENRFGVLSRVSGLFSSRGYNIGSLSVGETTDPSVSLITLTVTGDEDVLEQVKKQLNKLIDVIKVKDLTELDHLERELVLVQVQADSARRAEIIGIANIFRAKVVDIGEKSLTLEITGDRGKIRALLALIKPFGIKKLVRTGVVGIERS